MGKFLWVASLALVGCSSSSVSGNGSGSDGGSGNTTSGPLANFVGDPWSGTETTNLLCSPTSTSSGSIGLQFEQAGSGITYVSTAGCTFDFAVSGDMATLSNGPVVCNTTSGGVALTVTYQDYTMISDGQNLTATIDATAETGGTSCPFTESLILSR